MNQFFLICMLFAVGVLHSPLASGQSVDQSIADKSLIRPASRAFTPTRSDLANARRNGLAFLDIEAIRAPREEPVGFSAGGRVSVEPFAGERYTFDGSGVDQAQDGMLSWIGRPSNGEHGLFVLTASGTRVYATMEVGLKRFILSSNTEDGEGVVRVKEVDPASFPGCGVDDQMGAHAGKVSLNRSMEKSQPPGDTTIEAIVYYTPAVVTNQGDPALLINNLSASVNAALFGSSVTGSFRVVHYAEFPLIESAPMSAGDLETIRVNMQSHSSSPYDVIDDDRNTYRGDVVVMLVDHNSLGDDAPLSFAACGVSKAAEYSYDEWAYSVVSDGCAAGDLTFAHEIGHTLGGRHDWGMPGGTTCWVANCRGYTNTSVGYKTVMGSKTGGAATCLFASGCPRLSRFSSSSQMVNIGGTNYAVGVVDDDPGTTGNQSTEMITSLATTVPAVAGYKTTGASAPGQPASMTVDRLCSGVNELTWPAASGSVGWYEVNTYTNSAYTTGEVQVYRGGMLSLFVNVAGTRWARVRACNSEGCGSWRNGSQSLTVGCP